MVEVDIPRIDSILELMCLQLELHQPTATTYWSHWTP
jgi:hypothetical protein